MNRNMVLESFYKVIQESLEWAIGEKEYGYFVDGVVAMVEQMEIDECERLNRMPKYDKAEKMDDLKDVQHILEVEPVYINGESKVLK